VIRISRLTMPSLLMFAVGCAAPSAQTATSTSPALIIREQGSFAVGGIVRSTPGTYNNNIPTAEGQTFHGDHLYAFYQIPQNAKALPIVMLHGAFQSARSWETTPDGREGFQTIFLRRGFPVYLVDQPRRGRAGNSTVAATIEPTPFDQLFFDQFRIGKWPNYFVNVQFDRQPETLDQFFRSVTPNTGPYDAVVISDAMSALFAKIGPAILFTHSQGGGPGWLAAMKSSNIRAVVAYEPGSGFASLRLGLGLGGRLAWLACARRALGPVRRLHADLHLGSVPFTWFPAYTRQSHSMQRSPVPRPRHRFHRERAIVISALCRPEAERDVRPQGESRGYTSAHGRGAAARSSVQMRRTATARLPLLPRV